MDARTGPVPTINEPATDRVLQLMVSAFRPNGDAVLRRIFTHDLLRDPGCPSANRIVIEHEGGPAAALLIFEREPCYAYQISANTEQKRSSA